jgi:hypothetical protein
MRGAGVVALLALLALLVSPASCGSAKVRAEALFGDVRTHILLSTNLLRRISIACRIWDWGAGGHSVYTDSV